MSRIERSLHNTPAAGGRLRIAFIAASVCGALLSPLAHADSTERVSVDSGGGEASGPSRLDSISADGRFVAFESFAADLIGSDGNGAWDIFVHDRQTGATERVSVDSAGGEANSDSYGPAITPDGRFVAFYSFATDLAVGDSNGAFDVFVHDRQTGATERVSVDSGGGEANGHSYDPALSPNGRFVAFYSEATNLIGGDTNGASDVFVHDRQSGSTERVSVDGAGDQANGGSDSPAISPDGRFVAFSSAATNLVGGDTNGVNDVFIHDRQTGAIERVSVTSAGVQATGGGSYQPVFGADGRFVAFRSYADDLVPDDTNGDPDVFVHDRQTGTTERVSVGSAGAEANDSSWQHSISADGRFVAFRTSATNLVAGDSNGDDDIFVHDRLTGTTERVSVDSAGNQATGGDAYDPSISADGRFVAFRSYATNLVANDNNATGDIFVRDRGPQGGVRNDFLADFGAAGLWQRLNDTTWQKIHKASPTMIASGDLNGSSKDEAIASFAGAGLWARYDNATWMKLHKGAPKRFVAGDFDGSGEDDLIADFGAAGIWARRNDSAWAKLHKGTSQDMAAGDLDGNGKDELIADFGGAGLWVRYNDSTWVKRHNASPLHIAAGDLDGNGKDELIADFGGAGLWVRYNNAAWMKLHKATSQGIVTGDLDGNGKDELIVDFGGAGLWVLYNNSTWAKRHDASPQRMIAADLDGGGKADLVADFGAAGLWVKHNNGAWTKIHPATTQGLAAGGFD